MVRVLAVADEVDEALWRDPRPAASAQLIVACGDLPFGYLADLMEALDAPLVFVPGNHDADLGGYRLSRAGLMLRDGLPARQPWPDGALNADGRVLDVAGLRVAGLGGCLRYAQGPNQYTAAQFARRAARLRRRAARRRWRDRRPVDLLLTHAPPRGLGDGADAAHLGVPALGPLVGRLGPQLLLHGHVHPYGRPEPDRRLGATTVRNVVGWKLLTVVPTGACGGT